MGVGAAHGEAQSRSDGSASRITSVQRTRPPALRHQGAPLRRTLVCAVLALSGTIGLGQDATGVLREADQALGASNLKSIRYAGTGFELTSGRSEEHTS